MSPILNSIDTVPLSDWYISFIAIVIISIFLITVEIGVKYFNFSLFFTRKFIHIITGLIVCFISLILLSNLPIIIFATTYIVIDLWSLRKGVFRSIHPDSRSFGTVFYAISVIILAVVFWNGHKPLFIITNLIMIIPDAMAAIVGDRYAKTYFIPVDEKKSLLGAFTMFFLTIFIVFTSLDFFYNLPLENNVIISMIIGSIAMISELLSIRGSDNLSVPLISGIFLYALVASTTPDILWIITRGVLFAAIVAVLSHRVHFLNSGGSMLAFIMGSIIFGFGGLGYTFPILGFFLLSSLLSLIGKRKKREFETSYQKSGVRDFYQALANGGVPTMIVLIAYFSEIESIFFIYISALATATADTWATELGIFSTSKPRLITNFKPVMPGTSGGISLIGSISALTGSFMIVSIGHLFYPFTGYQIVVMTLSGFAGCFIDSLLGATIQGQFKCQECGKWTERKIHCQRQSILQHGNIRVDNDLVNIFSIMFSSILSFILLYKDII